MVAIDGASGAGKSTVAAMLEHELDITIIPLDDFFCAQIPDPKWDEFEADEKLKYVIDWERVRSQVILPLIQGQRIQWHSFDFQAGLRANGTYGVETEAKERGPARVILLEGAYSSSPALADLVDFTVLIDAPLEERHARIALREDPDFLRKWHERWDPVEEHYYNNIRPQDTFDLVVDGIS